MTRYLNSFLITLVLYIGVIFALFILFTNEKILLKKEKPLQQTISIKHIELLPVRKAEKKVVKVVNKKIKKKKIIKKKDVKKRPKKEKIVKKKKIVKKEKIITKEILRETILKPTLEKPKTQQIVKEKTDIKKDYLAKHLRMIRNKIKQNIHYPKSAKRLKIQGVVTVKFTLRNTGVVDNIVILNGHSRFKKSTINAVKDAASSFPKIKKDITIQLPIEYKLI